MQSRGDRDILEVTFQDELYRALSYELQICQLYTNTLTPKMVELIFTFLKTNGELESFKVEARSILRSMLLDLCLVANIESGTSSKTTSFLPFVSSLLFETLRSKVVFSLSLKTGSF